MERFHTTRQHLDDAIRALTAVREALRPEQLADPEDPWDDHPASRIAFVCDAADALVADFVGDEDALRGNGYVGYVSLCSCGGGCVYGREAK